MRIQNPEANRYVVCITYLRQINNHDTYVGMQLDGILGIGRYARRSELIILPNDAEVGGL